MLEILALSLALVLAGPSSDSDGAAETAGAGQQDEKSDGTAKDDAKSEGAKSEGTAKDDAKSEGAKSEGTAKGDAKADGAAKGDAKADGAAKDDPKSTDGPKTDAEPEVQSTDPASTEGATSEGAAAEDAASGESDSSGPDESTAPPTDTTPSLSGSAAAPSDPEAAAFKHAEGIDAELDGDARRALALLRKAHALDPDNELIQFDLARVSVIQGNDKSDLEPFFDNTDRSPAATQLRQAVGNRLNREVVEEQRLWAPPKWLMAGVATGLLIDSNVSLVPPNLAAGDPNLTVETDDDLPSELLGVRYTFDGAVIFRPLRKRLAIDAGMTFSLGKYLNGEELSPYDSAAFTVLGVLRADYEPVLFRLSISGTEMAADNFNLHYAHWANADADLRFVLADGHLGFYARARAHEYIGTEVRPGPYDRDGGQVGGGLVWDWLGSERLTFRGRLGLTYNFAPDGPKVQYQAAHIDASARLRIWRVDATAGLSGQGRIYEKVDFQGLGDQDTRIDFRVTPHLKASVHIWQYVGAYVGYSYTGNFSTSDASESVEGNFTYERHIATFGVEGRL